MDFVHDYTLTVPATQEPGTCISINSACKINIKHMKHYLYYIHYILHVNKVQSTHIRTCKSGIINLRTVIYVLD